MKMPLAGLSAANSREYITDAGIRILNNIEAIFKKVNAIFVHFYLDK